MVDKINTILNKKRRRESIDRYIENLLEVKHFNEFQSYSDKPSIKKFLGYIEPLKFYKMLYDSGIDKDEAMHCAYIYRNQVYNQIIKYLNHQDLLNKVK